MFQENHNKKIRDILIEKRGYDIKTPKDENVILLMTGGLDSSIGAELCIKKWNTTIYPLYIKRGATAQQWELESLEKVYKYLSKKYPSKINPPFFIDSKIPASEIKIGLKQERVFTRGHPLRNTIIQMYAVQYGVMLNDQDIQVESILTGSVGSDFFPGSRQIDLQLNTLTVCQNLEEWQWQILSPFHMDLLNNVKPLKKIDLIKWGSKNKFPFELTRTCTRSGKIACGECNECKERIETFKKSGLKDKILYA